MKLAIISGKGGTGKSSITSSLAFALGKRRKIVLVDADSDCPNQHILFAGKKTMERPLSVSKTAVIDYGKCTGCGACINACVFGAVRREEGKVMVSPIGCEGCGACALVCPENAVSLSPLRSGSLIVSETKKFPLVYARLFPGRSGTGRMVHEARRLADAIAEKRNAKLILIDAPPGIGCPLIASIAGCDHAIGVVEPTQASIANLKRVLEVAKHFGIPCSVVMNKKGLSKKYEKKIEAEFGKKLMARIPYDEEVPRLLARGIPPIRGKGASAGALKLFARRVEKIVYGGR